MKRLFILLCSLTLSASTFAAGRDTTRTKKVDESLLNSFREQFPDAEQVVWEALPETFAVNFLDHGVRTQITYDRQDAFVSSTRYYEERNLPHRILNILKKRYAGKTIFAITELTTEFGTEYHIKLQDDKVWLMVTMDSEGNIQNADEYQKTS
ncbi:MAG TPA: hypothetical protein VGM89_20380 [Puia sp.]